MKKGSFLWSNLAAFGIFILGLAVVVYMDARSYQGYVEQNTEQFVEMTANDISSEIDAAMSQSVDVSRTMAKDEFLIKWLEQGEHGADADWMDITSYLHGYWEEYDFDTVFLVSRNTMNYYYQDGMNKTISPRAEHDVWYYNFISKKVDYDMQIDTDEVDNDAVTLFVNCRITDRDGQLLGVVGVGRKIDLVAGRIRDYEERYDLQIHLINYCGTVNSFDGNAELFMDINALKALYGDDIEDKLSNSDVMQAYWNRQNGTQYCIASKYQENLKWEIIIAKDTGTLNALFISRLLSNAWVFGVVIVVCGALLYGVLMRHDRKLYSRENTDELTGLPNRKLFCHTTDAMYSAGLPGTGASVFMVDVDDFKAVNDTEGHLFGNSVLAAVGEELQCAVGSDGLAARWGGDEFVGVLQLTPEKADTRLQALLAAVRSRSEKMNCPVTLSVGVVEMSAQSLEKDIARADEALYRSKAAGKGRVTRI